MKSCRSGMLGDRLALFTFCSLILLFAWQESTVCGASLVSAQANGSGLAAYQLSWEIECSPGNYTPPYIINLPWIAMPLLLVQDGHSYIIGQFGDTTVFLAKYDQNGKVQWKHLLNEFVLDPCNTPGMVLDPQGNIVVLTYTKGTNQAIITISPAGDLVQTRAWGTDPVTRLGCLTFTSTGEMIGCGLVQVNDSNWDPYVVKVDPLGNMLWNTTWDDENDGILHGMTLSLVDDGDMFVSGKCFKGIDRGIEFLTRVHSNGTLDWYNPSLPWYILGCDSIGNVYTHGTTSNGTGLGEKGMIARISPTGTIIWGDERFPVQYLYPDLPPDSLFIFDADCVGDALYITYMAGSMESFNNYIAILDENDNILHSMVLPGTAMNIMDIFVGENCIYVMKLDNNNLKQYLVRLSLEDFSPIDFTTMILLISMLGGALLAITALVRMNKNGRVIFPTFASINRKIKARKRSKDLLVLATDCIASGDLRRARFFIDEAKWLESQWRREARGDKHPSRAGKDTIGIPKHPTSTSMDIDAISNRLVAEKARIASELEQELLAIDQLVPAARDIDAGEWDAIHTRLNICIKRCYEAELESLLVKFVSRKSSL